MLKAFKHSKDDNQQQNEVDQFYNALGNNDSVTVKALVEKNPKLLYSRSNRAFSPLHFVVERNFPQMLDLLLSLGAPTHLGDYLSKPAWHQAFCNDNTVLIDIFLKHRINLLYGSYFELQCISGISTEASFLNSKNKFKILSALFAQGMGIDSRYISKQILGLFNLDYKTIGPFLIAVEKKQDDDTWRTHFIYQWAQLEEAVSKPEQWRLNREALHQTTLLPELENNPNAIRIKNLLGLSNPREPLPTACSLSIVVNAEKPTTALLENYIVIPITQYRMSQEDRNLGYNIYSLIDNFFFAFDETLTESLRSPTTNMQNIAMAFHQLTSVINSVINYITLVLPKSEDFLSTIYNSEGIDALKQLYRNSHGYLSYLTVLDLHLKYILKKYGAQLARSCITQHATILAHRVQVLQRLAFAQFQLDPDVSLSHLKESLLCIRKMTSNEATKGSISGFTADYHNLMCAVYINRRWYAQALKYLRKIKSIEFFGTHTYIINLIQLIKYAQAEGKKKLEHELLQQSVASGHAAIKLHVSSTYSLKYLEDSKKRLQNFEESLKQQAAKVEELPQLESLSLKPIALPGTSGKFEEEDAISDIQDSQSESDQDVPDLEALRASWLEFEKAKLLKDKAEKASTQIDQLPGFTPFIPIRGSGLPKNALFITLPENEPSFAPFYHLIRDRHGKYVDSIPSIDAKGLNQRGVKLTSQYVYETGERPYKQAIARLKGTSTLRAIGYAQQLKVGENEKQRSVYVIRHLIDKKDEKRHGYRFN